MEGFMLEDYYVKLATVDRVRASRLAIRAIGSTALNIAARTAVSTVATTGVLWRTCTRAKTAGSMPSCDIARGNRE